MATRIEWNVAAFRDIRVNMARGMVAEKAQAVASRAGAGFETDGYVTGGKGRYRAIVFAATYEASRANAQDNVLVKALF